MIRSIKSWFPIKRIENGVILLKSGKYCKILEVCPINFTLKAIKEQEEILYKYKTFLNSCDFDVQILVQSKRANLDSHIKKIEERMEREGNEKVKALMNDYINMVKNEVIKSTITKKFYIIFLSSKGTLTKEQAILELMEKTVKIKNSLSKCGNSIKEFSGKEIANILYTYMNLKTSKIQPLNRFLEVK